MQLAPEDFVAEVHRLCAKAAKAVFSPWLERDAENELERLGCGCSLPAAAALSGGENRCCRYPRWWPK